jgi:membrane protein YdbS with pleckstrin-like domain
MRVKMAKIIKRQAASQELPFGKTNLYILGIGLAVLVIGYLFMAQPPVNSFWSRTLAPVVVLIAYLIIIPYSLFYRRKKENQNE